MVSLNSGLVTTVTKNPAKVLESKWGMRTVGDLLRHYPRRYVRHGELTDLASLAEGEDVTIVGRVIRRELRKLQRRPYQLFEVTVQDATGNTLQLSFFGTGVHRADKELQQGTLAMIAGRVGSFRGKVQLNHPDFEVIPERASAEAVEEYATRPIPIYPAAKEIASWKIKRTVDYVLDLPDLQVPDPMPPEVLARHHLIPLAEALERIHRPRDEEELAAARRRLKWDEAFYVQLALARRGGGGGAAP
ncbi:OB-fold nucleic acid binding domain-containing protein, partial [Actinocorallia libanotica]|uniref:OB-fold nucleic acid binding domain-containing protein n=1 Tax=Actinocorallia libanotica TaxID=46162 RepID=UPI0031DBCF2D